MLFVKLFTFLSFLLLAGCQTVTTTPAGDITPVLKQPIPRSHKLIVISTFGQKVFTDYGSVWFKNRRTDYVNAIGIDTYVGKRLVNALAAKGYQAELVILTEQNPLTQDSVESTLAGLKDAVITGASQGLYISRGTLSTSAKILLGQLAQKTHADTIVLLAPNPRSFAPYYINCDKQNNASITLSYKLYLIDAHTLGILAWVTDSLRAKLPNAKVCSETNPTNIREIIGPYGLPLAISAIATLNHTLSDTEINYKS